MRLAALLLFLPASLLAGDLWIPIAGSVNNFRSDARILNPSTTKDIQVRAVFLPINETNNGERVAGGVTITIPKRQMKVYDDVVSSLFNASGLGAILLVSSDDFIATSRIYAQTATGTLGQFSVARNPGLASPKGVLIQLKSNSAFRTNIGAVNIANAETRVTWTLYDKNNAVVSSGTTTMAAYQVLGPTAITSGVFFQIPSGTDLSDAWVSYTSTNPIFAYASVIDNATTDPTFIPHEPDTGVTQSNPTGTTRTFDVTLRSGSITFSPAPNNIKVGDTVVLRIRSTDVTHGFQLEDASGKSLVPSAVYSPSAGVVEKTFTVAAEGTHSYFCTLATCSPAHSQMFGTFTVGASGPDDPGRGY